MLVRRYYDHADLKVKIAGEIFHAPEPAVSLDEKTAEAIKKAVFGTTMF